jgi:LSD1 subclass zinc finger protein
MSITTQCPRCRTVLNLPDGAVNRRLRCPKCETRFYSGTEDSTPPQSAPAVDSAGLASGTVRTSRPSEPDLPVIPGSLRDTFDLPLLDDSGPPAARPKPATAGALFDDIPPPRKATMAEARKKPRRCPTCGSLVLAGMSLCDRCGLDLDTGERHTFEEEEAAVGFDEPPAEFAPEGPPTSIVLIGIMSLAASAVLAVLSLTMVEQLVGKLSFGLVCGFGLYASIQFLRGRSFKLLLIAMMLGGVVNVIGLVILPIVAANEEPAVVPGAPDPGPELDDVPQVKIKNMAEDPELTRKLGWGIGLLLLDAAAFVYLATASSVHRHFHRRHATGPPFV